MPSQTFCLQPWTLHLYLFLFFHIIITLHWNYYFTYYSLLGSFFYSTESDTGRVTCLAQRSNSSSLAMLGLKPWPSEQDPTALNFWFIWWSYWHCRILITCQYVWQTSPLGKKVMVIKCTVKLKCRSRSPTRSIMFRQLWSGYMALTTYGRLFRHLASSCPITPHVQVEWFSPLIERSMSA